MTNIRHDQNKGENRVGVVFTSLLLILFISFLTLWIFSFGILDLAFANTAQSQLTIGNVPPELNVTVQSGAATFTLTAGTNTTLYCNGTVWDYNGYADIVNVTAVFYSLHNSTNSLGDDYNNHYTQNNCTIFSGSGDYALFTCPFNITYFAVNNTWNCNVTATDHNNTKGYANDTININALVALDVPATINYGVVNALNSSLENQTNVTNFGNVKIDLTLDGYGYIDGDGNAMNCTGGSTKNISIEYEKYNVTGGPTPDPVTFATLNNFYKNLTDTPVAEEFNLLARTNDTENEAKKSTYWRIWVPTGVAGTCLGNVVFTATASG